MWFNNNRTQFLQEVNIMFNHNKQLTTREFSVAFEVLKGKTTKEIAKALFITDHTVKAHLNHIFYKTGSTNKLNFIIDIFTVLIKDNFSPEQIFQALNTLTFANKNIY